MVANFMKTREDAQKLAEQMVRIGNLAGREVRCVLTPMDQPLGYAIGNSLEIIEAINFLKGDMPNDLKEVVLELGANDELPALTPVKAEGTLEIPATNCAFIVL